MKRSEAIKELNLYFIENTVLYKTVHPDNVSYDVINILMQLGMLPPKIKKHSSVHNEIRILNEWEEEDKVIYAKEDRIKEELTDDNVSISISMRDYQELTEYKRMWRKVGGAANLTSLLKKINKEINSCSFCTSPCGNDWCGGKK